MKYIKTFEGFLGESKYKGNIAGDAAKYIAKELSQYVKGIISQPNNSVTYFHVNDKSDKSKVIKTLLDVYGIEAVDGGNMFTSSPTIKFDNDQLLESINKGLVNENKPVNAESDIIEKIKKLLPHMHQKDADHNAKVMLKQYKDGTLKSGVIYNQIKKLIKEEIRKVVKEVNNDPQDFSDLAITEGDHLITAAQVSKMHGDAKDEDKELVAAANKLIAKLLPKYDIEDILAYIKHTVMLDTKQ